MLELRQLSIALISTQLALLTLGCADDSGSMNAQDDTTGNAPSSTDTGDAADESTEGSDGAETGADASGDDTTGQPPTEGTGEELYGMLCAPCHGNDALGTALGYELRHPVRDFSNWVVRNGRPGDEFPDSAMANYAAATIDDAALHRVWDYLDSFPQPDTGEGLYMDYCANCHGADATGGVVGHNISDKEFDDILEEVREGKDLDTPGARMRFMPAWDASQLTDDELQQIADFIAG